MELMRREKKLTLPNLLTILRILMLPVIAWRFFAGDMTSALTLYVVAMLTDAADGILARRLGQITALGRLLDPVADKLSLLTLTALFVLDGQIPPWVMAVLLLKEILLIAGSVFVLRVGVVVSSQMIGKVTTVAFILSFVTRFLGWRSAADRLLYLSLLLSLAALLWYLLAGVNKLQHKASCKA